MGTGHVGGAKGCVGGAAFAYHSLRRVKLPGKAVASSIITTIRILFPSDVDYSQFSTTTSHTNKGWLR